MIRNKEIVFVKSCGSTNNNTGTSATQEEEESTSRINNDDSSKPGLSNFIAKKTFVIQSRRVKKKRQQKDINVVVSVPNSDGDDDNSSIISALSEPAEFVGLPDDCSSFLQHEDHAFPVFQQSLMVDRIWKQQVQCNLMAGSSYDKKEQLGKQIVLCIAAMDSLAQENMRIASLDTSSCTRFGEVSHMLVDTVDVMVSLMGPDIDEFQDELQELGQQCKREGIPIHLLGSATGEAIRLVLREQHGQQQPQQQDKMSEEDVVLAWKIVIDFVASKMR